MYLVDQPRNSPFTPAELARLEVYRAAVAAGFYSDTDADSPRAGDPAADDSRAGDSHVSDSHADDAPSRNSDSCPSDTPPHDGLEV